MEGVRVEEGKTIDSYPSSLSQLCCSARKRENERENGWKMRRKDGKRKEGLVSKLYLDLSSLLSRVREGRGKRRKEEE